MKIIGYNVSIGQASQYFNYKNGNIHVIIGNSNTIDQFVTIHRGTVEGFGITRIGLIFHCHVIV